MPNLQGSGAGYNYEKKITGIAIFCCAVAASGGALFGYDLGVAGGVSNMDYFLETFFHSVWESKNEASKTQSPYCAFDSQTLQVFQSSLYLAALAAAIVSSYVAKFKGRKLCMVLAGMCYLAGSGLTAGAVAKPAGLSMLIIGRCLLGCGVGFGNSSVTIYSSEIAPPRYRGTLNMLFQWCVTIGIMVAQLINYGVEGMHKNGWRVSLACAAVPGFMILAGGIFLPETPSSLIARNHLEEGRKVLQRIRGQEDVELEYQAILENSRQDSSVKHPMLEAFKPCYRPYLVVAMALSFFQQLSGMNSIMFYAPQIMSTFSKNSQKAALLQTVIIGVVNMACTIVGLILVDHAGRRRLFIYSGVIMSICEVIVGVSVGYYFGHNDGKLPEPVAKGILAVICVFVANYAWSWGPLCWLVPAEVMPNEIRSGGAAITTFTNMLFTFVIAQCFLSMMCHMIFGVFLFFAGWCVIMVIFVALFLPEPKGLHVEEVYEKFTAHWFWKRYPAPPRPRLPSTKKIDGTSDEPKPVRDGISS